MAEHPEAENRSLIFEAKRVNEDLGSGRGNRGLCREHAHIMIAVIVVLLVLSTFVVAFIFYRIIGKREAEAEANRDDDEADVTRLQSMKDALGLLIGPFPLSVALHVIALLFLIITVHEQRGRELIMVNLEAGGGGGGGNEMQDLDMPEVPMPDTAPQQMEQPTRGRYLVCGGTGQRLRARGRRRRYRNRARRGHGLGLRARNRLRASEGSSASCAARGSTWCWSSTAPAR